MIRSYTTLCDSAIAALGEGADRVVFSIVSLAVIVWLASYIDSMTDLYERAAAKWFSLPKVLSGFVRFAQHTAASRLAIKAIPWIAGIMTITTGATEPRKT
jgi:hypothetical protein